MVLTGHLLRMLNGKWAWLAVLLAALAPFFILVLNVIRNTLGPDPAQSLMHATGEWSLRLLVLVLAARPLAYYRFPFLFRHRRVLGNLTFFYASLHALVFAQVYIGWSSEILLEELTERPYVWIGFAAWILMLPLALTSTDGMRRRLRQHWRRLHRAVYPVAIFGTLHLLWLSRSDIGEALIYGAGFGVLLLWRARRMMRRLLSVLMRSPAS